MENDLVPLNISLRRFWERLTIELAGAVLQPRSGMKFTNDDDGIYENNLAWNTLDIIIDKKKYFLLYY